MDGLLIVDKPVGPTSHDVVAAVRRALGERRIGHTGTLDPDASGVLPLVVGRATRLARFLSGQDKAYRAGIRLGVATDTYDSSGEATAPPYDGPWPARQVIESALDSFRGTFLQRPPAYSAKKVGGKRSYRLVRSAGPGSRDDSSLPTPVFVTVHRLDLLNLHDDRLELELECSAGFYVRSLAHDLGTALRTGAHLAALQRTRSGRLSLADALPLAVIVTDPAQARSAVVSLSDMLAELATARLTAEGARRAVHGRELRPEDLMGDLPAVVESDGGEQETFVRLIDQERRLVCIARRRGRSLLHPLVVLI